MAFESLAEMGTIMQGTLMSFWDGFVYILPGLLAAIIVLIVGVIIGKIAGRIVAKVLNKVKLDYWIQRNKLSEALYGKQLSSILGSLLKWYIIIIFLGEAANLVQLTATSYIIRYISFYLPLLIGAGLVVLAGMLIGEYLKKLVTGTKMAHKYLFGEGIKWLTVYFSVVIGLQTAGFEVTILLDAFRIGFTALAIVAAIILGMGFGFAFRKDIEKLAKDFQKEFKKKR